LRRAADPLGGPPVSLKTLAIRGCLISGELLPENAAILAGDRYSGWRDGEC